MFTATVIEVELLNVGAEVANCQLLPPLIENFGQLDAVKPVPENVTSW